MAYKMELVEGVGPHFARLPASVQVNIAIDLLNLVTRVNAETRPSSPAAMAAKHDPSPRMPMPPMRESPV